MVAAVNQGGGPVKMPATHAPTTCYNPPTSLGVGGDASEAGDDNGVAGRVTGPADVRSAESDRHGQRGPRVPDQ